MRMAKTSIRKTTEILGLILLSVCACMASDGEKGIELNRALNEIRGTAQLIGERVARLAAVYGQMQAQAEALKVEIHQERHRCGALTFQQALQVRRIDYDLRLLQQVMGYLWQLEDWFSYFRTAEHTLAAYRDHIRDDLLMLRALNDVDISDTLRHVGKIVHEYQRKCTVLPPIAQPACGPRELEIIWSQISKGH